MLYKYIYYYFFRWSEKHYGKEYPQFYSISIINILILFNIFTLLKLFYFIENDSKLSEFMDENAFVIVLLLLFILYIVNSLYFFKINSWHEIVKYFENHKIKTAIKTYFYLYFLGTIFCFISSVLFLN